MLLWDPRRCGSLEKFIQRFLHFVIIPSLIRSFDTALSYVCILVNFIGFFLEDVNRSTFEDVRNGDIPNIRPEYFLHSGEVSPTVMFEPQLAFIFELAGASNSRVLLFGFIEVIIRVDLHLDCVRLILGKFLFLAPIVPAFGVPCSLLLICLAVPHHLGVLIAIWIVLANFFNKLIDDVIIELLLVLL